MQGGIVEGEEDEDDYVPVASSPPQPTAVPIQQVPTAAAPSHVDPVEQNAPPAAKTTSPRAGLKKASPRQSKRGSRGFGGLAKQHMKSGFDDDSDGEETGSVGSGASFGTTPRHSGGGIPGGSLLAAGGGVVGGTNGPPVSSLLTGGATAASSSTTSGSTLQGNGLMTTATPDGSGFGGGYQAAHTSIPHQQIEALRDPRDQISVEKEVLFSDSLKSLLDAPPKGVPSDWKVIPKPTIATNFPTYRELLAKEAKADGTNGVSNLSASNLATLQQGGSSSAASPLGVPDTPRSDSNSNFGAGGLETPRSSLASGVTPRLRGASMATSGRGSLGGLSSTFNSPAGGGGVAGGGTVNARLVAKLGQLEADIYELKRVNAIEVVKSSTTTLAAMSNNVDSMNRKAYQAKGNMQWSTDVGNVLAEAIGELSTRTAPAFFRM